MARGGRGDAPATAGAGTAVAGGRGGWKAASHHTSRCRQTNTSRRKARRTCMTPPRHTSHRKSPLPHRTTPRRKPRTRRMAMRPSSHRQSHRTTPLRRPPRLLRRPHAGSTRRSCSAAKPSPRKGASPQRRRRSIPGTVSRIGVAVGPEAKRGRRAARRLPCSIRRSRSRSARTPGSLGAAARRTCPTCIPARRSGAIGIRRRGWREGGGGGSPAPVPVPLASARGAGGTRSTASMSHGPE